MQQTEEQRTIRFSIKNQPILRAFMRDVEHFITLIQGPFGSAKSSTCLMKIIKLANMQTPGPDGVRRVRWAIVRNTYPQLKDTTIKTVLDWLPEKFFGLYNKTDHNYFITEIPGLYIELMFRALDRPDHVSNLLSMELTGIWFNEYREIPKEIFEAGQGRVGRFPAQKDGGCTWFGVLGDTNPPEDGSYYYRLAEEVRPDNLMLYKQPSGLSPEAENIDNLPANYYSNLAKGKSTEWVNVYIHGRYGFIPAGEPVTPEYNPELHRSKEPLDVLVRARAFRAYDGGLNPTCHVGQIAPSGQIRIYKTFRGENIGMEQLIDTMLIPYLSREFKDKKVEDWMDVGDPSLANREQSNADSSAAKVIEKKLRRFGCTGLIEGVDLGGRRIIGRSEGLNKMIGGRPWVILDPSNIILHKALNGGWHYPDTATGKALKDKPLKDIHSHPGDAFSYLMAELLGYHEATQEQSTEDFVFLATAMSGKMGY